MFGIDLKDLKGGIVFIIIIIMFCFVATWNSSRINKDNTIDNNNDIVYNIGSADYE